MPIAMIWTPLPFGKHRGKTLPQVMFADPDWFFWAYEQGAFAAGSPLRREAERIYRRARNIRVPQDPDGERLVAEYAIDPITGRFADLELVPADRPAHDGGTPTHRSEVIDMAVPREFTDYDKGGMKLLIRALKQYLFGGTSQRMTKERCEAFFDDAGNFVL